jgi:hypothetical protein
MRWAARTFARKGEHSDAANLICLRLISGSTLSMHMVFPSGFAVIALWKQAANGFQYRARGLKCDVIKRLHKINTQCAELPASST